MAYTLDKAMARLRSGPDTTWREVDISAVGISDLFTTYYKVWLFLTNPLYPDKTLYLNLEDIKPIIGMSIVTLSVPDWLASLGNLALPTTMVAPDMTVRPVLFQDLWDAGYSVDLTDASRTPEEPLPELDKHDLLITRPDTDYQFMEGHALISINGLFHRSGASQAGIYVLGGADSWRRGNDNRAGICTFTNVGQISILPITSSMVLDPVGAQKLSKYAYINLGVSVEGKSVLFVIGGYLHAMDHAYQPVGDGIFRLNMCQLPILERIFESGKIIDLSSLNLEISDSNPDQVVLSEIFSDDVMRAYLTLSQSFAVVVDSPSMYMRRHMLESTGLPGRYYGYQTRHFPLLVNHGELAEYLVSYNDGIHLYACATNLRNRYRMVTTDYLSRVSVDSSRLSDKPHDYSPGYLLEFGSIS